MASSNHDNFFSVATVAVLLHAVTVLLLAANAVTALHLCENSDYKGLCRSVIKNDQNVTTATVKGICGMLTPLKGAKATAKKFKVTAKDKMTKSTFNACEKSYDSAICDLNKALDYLTAARPWVGHPISLKNNLFAATTYVRDCDEAFQEGRGSDAKSPLTSLNKHLTQLSANALALVEVIEKKINK